MEHTAIDKALDVLFHLRTQAEPSGVTEIGRALALPKSSAHRLLTTLTRRGLLERDEAGRYRLGLGLVTLAQGFAQQDPVVGAGRSALEALARDLGETCFFVAARGGRLVVLDKVEGTGFLRASPEVGAEVPVSATASGKLYQAFAAEDLDTGHAQTDGDGSAKPPARFTARTLSREAFAEAVAEAAQRGYACNRGEWLDGLSVLALPIFSRGKLVAALSVAAPSGRLEEAREAKVVARIRSAVADIAERLEHGAASAASRTGT